MFNLIFVGKIFLLSVLLLFVMQVRIGESTLEDKAMFMLQDSAVVEPLRDVALGAAHLADQGYRVFARQMGNLARSFSDDSQEAKKKH